MKPIEAEGGDDGRRETTTLERPKRPYMKISQGILPEVLTEFCYSTSCLRWHTPELIPDPTCRESPACVQNGIGNGA